MVKFKNTYLKDVDLKKATSLFDSFDVDPNVSFENQEFAFREDLIQVTYPKDYLVDVGWYPEHTSDGSYTVEIIHNRDWENPVYITDTSDFYEMKKCLQNAIDLADSLSHENI